MPVYICTECPSEKESKRLPKGWKDIPGSGPTCGDCVSGGWVSRCVRLQVATVLEVGGEPGDYRGVTFWRPFDAAWRLSTDLANWGQRELLRHDIRRTPEMTRLPPMPVMAGGLYRRWNETYTPAERAAWDGSTQAAAAILRAVELKWKGIRLPVLWKGESSACTYRYPYPCVVPGQSVRMGWLDHPGGRIPTVSLLLPGSGRVLLRVDRGRDWHRQLRDFDAMVTGQAVQGDVKACVDMANGKKSGVKLMCFGRFRRRAAEPTGRTAILRTCSDALVSVEVADRDEPFTVHRPDLIGHMQAHERYRESRSNDMKYEKRWPARQRRRMVESGQAANTKYANRLDTITQQVAACVIGFCRRQQVDTVVYDDSNQTYARGFRYFALRERVRQNCDTAGIRFQTLEESQVVQAG